MSYGVQIGSEQELTGDRREFLSRCKEGIQGQDAQRRKGCSRQGWKNYPGSCLPKGRKGCSSRSGSAGSTVVRYVDCLCFLAWLGLIKCRKHEGHLANGARPLQDSSADAKGRPIFGPATSKQAAHGSPGGRHQEHWQGELPHCQTSL